MTDIERSKNIKAILFDLDGVLVDTLHYHYLAWQKQFDQFGKNIKKHTVLLNEGRNSREILPILLNEAGISLPACEYNQFIENKRSYYREIVQVTFYPGALEAVEYLKSRDYIVAIVTACAQKTMKKSLDQNKRDLFDLIQTGDDLNRAKPHPDPYDMAGKKLGVVSSECLVVENAPLGITSAKRAGMMCVAIETTLGREFLKEADYILKNISELIHLPLLN